MKKFFITLLLAITITSSVGIVKAYQVNVNGGTWNYGISNKYVWSNYYHGSKAHYSTAIGRYKSTSGYTPRRSWSKASAVKRPGWQIWKVNRTYYGFY
ncbi:lactococcin 972 family bacteriocin [Mammaliicoccus vitulinus]|uniref:lactococcin 972 family bacteriocin n=1 Tax=Mammaliicoccus vitulinus TaxID=71237 RepID=UPI000308A87F|nr:lactococcin 972 family bacteriocin [Mammaliicoccus vitulinus]MBM6630033.1 lactococcin 972 family bacteriocin [Mammaliicoccus vitulinus]MBO3076445.1 lactococcin 972 family bacteriocin [Mammaliicoccus vitulinus]QJF24570.1 lactococcin 972 family bacteriocin [Mammaliicoccus vitulinus]QTN12603.1 lactococcin 972 family bacteriocin [Mammaliicoccus vitulinus]WQK87359.1 lactococcin 972 family bacteriocin [Mammaliicoccus vitulinus]